MSAKGTPISKLIEAIRQASLHRLVSALDDGCDIEEADQHGLRGLPLRTACFSGNVEIVRELIKRGADVNAAGYDGPGMPLRLALRAGKPEIIRLLLASGANLPPGLVIPPEFLAEPAAPVIAIPEIPAMEFAPVSKESILADFLPDPASARPASGRVVYPDNYHVDEEVDITANYGIDTNTLNMDMLRFDDQADKGEAAAGEEPAKKPAEQKKGGFWKSGRQS